ncbi:MAG: class I SAM-dependent methyltransferase [Planctomycetes bacterium]|nr:class I SAM-dependent methyltransferase [Planctomycetota bacterium]
MNCRHCGRSVSLPLVDLGTAPPSNAYLSAERLQGPEAWFPLKVLVCEGCWLAQTEDVADASLYFDAEYAYFSGYSRTWLDHSRRYVEAMVDRFGLSRRSHVVEVAANDGALLQFVHERGISCLGIEPTASTAAAARARGLQVVEEFFGVGLADRLVAAGRAADLTAANNVLAHVPNINDFTAGFATLLAPDGVATFEFPHLLRLLEETQFDTIYHEHFSYLSLTSVSRIFTTNGLAVFDVEELPTHGGSLRVFAQRADTGVRPVHVSVPRMLAREKAVGLTSRAAYEGFQRRAERIKHEFLEFLLAARRDGKTVVAYGAAAKGNTLLNFAGVRPELIACVADRNPAKQGKRLPGSRIPIVDERELESLRPDYVVILPWNIRAEVEAQLADLRRQGTRFVTAIPRLKVA